MGILRYDSVEKSDTIFTSLRRLRRYLARAEPNLIRLLVTLWENQAGALTYKEIREALMRGSVDAQNLAEWRQDYSRFIEKKLRPQWMNAISASLKELQARFPEWQLDMTEDMDRFCQERSGFFVTQCTDTQHKAINAVIERAAIMQDTPAIELSQTIRPLVGLTAPQALTNFKFYQDLRNSGLGHTKARERCVRLASRQHRYRALNIARTEMAWAYNKGEFEGVRRAQQEGYLGQMVKVWCTADDERVCPVCGGLDGKEYQMDESMNFPDRMLWEGFMQAPPAHCSCRCVLLYKEISPPFGGREEG